MALFRRRQFDGLIKTQLEVFLTDHGDSLRDIQDARERWRRASAESADEAYGDERDLVDGAAEELSFLCDGFARTLDFDTEQLYRREFTRAVRKRLPQLADAFEEQTDTGEPV